jgi:hypothetical protein
MIEQNNRILLSVQTETCQEYVDVGGWQGQTYSITAEQLSVDSVFIIQLHYEVSNALKYHHTSLQQTIRLD